MKAKTASVLSGLALCWLGSASPASALVVATPTYDYNFNYSDGVGDTASLDIETQSPVNSSGVPISSIFGLGDFAVAFGSNYAFSIIFGPDTTCCGADNLLYSTAPYVDTLGIAFDVEPFEFFDPPVLVTSDSGGTLTPSPLPAALPLFAGGLGMIGLISRRRKRKQSSALAAA